MHQGVLDRVMALHAKLHPDWRPTIYLNTAFAESEAVVKIADAKEGDVYQYWLPIEALEYHPVFKFPQAERLFRERGYVHDDEVTAFAHGQHAPHIIFLDVNLSALRTQLFVFKALLAEILRADSPYQFTGAKSGYYAAFMGGMSGSHPDEEPTLLAERDGVLLPWLDQTLAHPFHLAYSAVDDTVRIQPMDIEKHFGDQNADQLTIKTQVSKELANSTLYFSGATPVALTLWHSQILAYLRKIAARIEVECGAHFNAVGEIAEDQNRKLLATTRERMAAKLPYEMPSPRLLFNLSALTLSTRSQTRLWNGRPSAANLTIRIPALYGR